MKKKKKRKRVQTNLPGPPGGCGASRVLGQRLNCREGDSSPSPFLTHSHTHRHTVTCCTNMQFTLASLSLQAPPPALHLHLQRAHPLSVCHLTTDRPAVRLGCCFTDNQRRKQIPLSCCMERHDYIFCIIFIYLNFISFAQLL